MVSSVSYGGSCLQDASEHWLCAAFVQPNLLSPAIPLAYWRIAVKLLAYPDTETFLPAYPDMGLG